MIDIVQFPSIEAVRSFLDDPDDAPHAIARRAGSAGQFHAIDDTNAAGMIPYLSRA